MTWGREASTDEEAQLMEFMAQFEPVKAVPMQTPVQSEAVSECRCGRQVARPGALCIKCGNTRWLGQGHAERPAIRHRGGLQG